MWRLTEVPADYEEDTQDEKQNKQISMEVQTVVAMEAAKNYRRGNTREKESFKRRYSEGCMLATVGSLVHSSGSTVLSSCERKDPFGPARRSTLHCFEDYIMILKM